MAMLSSLSMKGKLTLAGCVVGFLVVAVLLLKMASAPSYATIQTGIDPAQTSKVTAALDAQGIAWELQNGGTAIAVEKAQTTAARVALAGAGLNTAKQPGFELLDQQKLGASNQQQQVAYQRGLEGEIANTISQIQGAEGSTVNLTLPKDDLFSDDKQGATAAVLLGGSADTLQSGAVRGIANLVASSVPGLKPASVTITDATGQMLWPAGEGASGDPSGGGLAAKPAAEARYNAQMASSLNAMLTQTLGAGKAQVQVAADLNVDKASKEQLQYDAKGVPLKSTTESEALTGTGAASGTSGAATNLPSYAAGAAGAAGGGGNYRSKKGSTDWGVGKTVTRTQVAPGAVNRLSVSVLVDQSTKPNVAALTRAIQSAVGFNAGRGDTVQVQAIAFAKPPAAATPKGALPIPPGLASPLKAVGIGIAALLFLFFITRALRKRESGALMDEPSWLRELEAVRPAAPALELPSAGPDLPTIATSDPRRQALDQIIANEPERVAAHLRGWITEDGQ